MTGRELAIQVRDLYEGFQNIVLRNLGASSVLVPAGVVVAYSVAFFVLALWRLWFE